MKNILVLLITLVSLISCNNLNKDYIYGHWNFHDIEFQKKSKVNISNYTKVLQEARSKHYITFNRDNTFELQTEVNIKGNYDFINDSILILSPVEPHNDKALQLQINELTKDKLVYTIKEKRRYSDKIDVFKLVWLKK